VLMCRLCNHTAVRHADQVHVTQFTLSSTANITDTQPTTPGKVSHIAKKVIGK